MLSPSGDVENKDVEISATFSPHVKVKIRSMYDVVGIGGPNEVVEVDQKTADYLVQENLAEKILGGDE